MATYDQTPGSTPDPNDQTNTTTATQTGNNLATQTGNNLTTQTGAPISNKYAFKQCPRFDPVYYRGWAAEVRDAFAERNWTEYLLPQNQDFTPDPRILVQAKAFLSQAISYEHKAGMEHCTTAAEMFNSLEQQYGQITPEDEMRLETQLIHMRKQATDTIEQHITKFKALISAVMAQQDAPHKYSNSKRNQFFIASLEYAFIDDEPWEGLVPYLGASWSTMTPERLYAATQTYYYAHILPRKLKKSTATPNATEGNVYWTKSTSKNPNTNTSNREQPQNRGRNDKFNNFNNRSNHYNNPNPSNFNNSNSNFNNPNNPSKSNNSNTPDNSNNPNNSNNSSNSNNRPREKYDGSKYCFHHRQPGHSTESCRAKLRDETYLQFQQFTNQQSPDHRANLISNIRAFHTSTDNDTWVYDSCCTEQ